MRPIAGMKNSYRVAGPVVESNFGLVEVDWEAASGPIVTLSLNTVNGEVAFTYSFELEKLQ